jgi:hypothetical protein
MIQITLIMRLECKRDIVVGRVIRRGGAMKRAQGIKKIKVYCLYMYGDRIKNPPNIVFQREERGRGVKEV